MRRIALLLALLLAPATAAAQAGGGAGVIRGTVVSAGGQPLAGVSVAVRAAADSAVAGTTTTGADGRFSFTGLRPGRYFVQASRVDLTPASRGGLAITAAAPAVDVGPIQLAANAVAIQGLEVRGERSQVVVAPDRTIYSTADMPVAQGGMATDVLRSVPELEVDIDGNVQLRGTGAQIYLNGRPAPMNGESLNQFLAQFPADRIDRIEVLQNPSARFESEGSGGIVNIVLKKNTSLGLSGNVSLNGGTRGELGGGARLTYQSGPLTLFGGGFTRFQQQDNTSVDFRQNLAADPITFLSLDAESERRGGMAAVDLTAEYRLGERTTVWGESRVFRRGNASDVLTRYLHLNADSLPTQRYNRDTEGDQSSLSTDFVAGYRHVREQGRHEVEAEARFERGREDDENLIRRLFFTPGGDEAGLPVELTVEDEGQDQSELSLQLDYIRPMGEEGQVEFGYRGDFERVENGRLLEIFTDEAVGVPSSSDDRGFSHRENFHSGYVTLMQKFGPLGVQAGVRAEQADTRFESFDKDYASLFPSANVSYQIDDSKEVRLSYNKRIQRPGPWILNPIDQSNDPLNRRIGNPDIDPQYTHNVSLQASWSGQLGTLRFSPYYRRTTDEWTQIKTVDQAGVSTVTWQNLAAVEAYGSSLTASFRQIAGTSGNLTVSGYREDRDASNLALAYSGTSTRWSVNGNVMKRITPALSFQAMANYQPAREVPQGRLSSSFMSHVGIRQQFWNNKASLNVSLRDPFNLYRQSFTTSDRSFVQSGSSRFKMQSAMIGFSYSFGRPPRSSRGGQGNQEPEAEEAPGAEIR